VSFCCIVTVASEICSLSLHGALPISEPMPVMRQQRRVVTQQLVRAQQQLGKVDQAGAVATLLVRGVAAAHDIGPLVIRIGLQVRSEEHTSELQSRENLVCRLLLEKKI